MSFTEGITVSPVTGTFTRCGCVITSNIAPVVKDYLGGNGYALQFNLQPSGTPDGLQLICNLNQSTTTFQAILQNVDTNTWFDPTLELVKLSYRLFDLPGDGLQIDATLQSDGSISFEFLMTRNGVQSILYGGTTPANLGGLTQAGVGLVGEGAGTASTFSVADFVVSLNETGAPDDFILAPGAGNTQESSNLSAKSIKTDFLAGGRTFTGEFGV